MTHIPVVLGLTALVAVPTAVGIHFLSASKTTQTQEVTEQNQLQQREVSQQKGDVKTPIEEATYDFSDVDVEATDLEEVNTEASRVPSQGSQPAGNQDPEYPPLTSKQLELPTLTTDLMGATEMQSDSIGPKFKTYLLSDPKDDQWVGKTKLWAQKFVDESKRSSLTSIFTTQTQTNKPVWSRINVRGLQSRCTKAYSRTTWHMPNNIDRNNYWNTVKELCGRNGQEFPNTWNQA